MKKCLFIYILLSALLLWGCGGSSDDRLEPDVTLSVTPSLVTIDADAGREEFVVEASGNWTLSGIPEWCSSVRPDRGGAGKTTVSVGGKFYDGEQDRTATLTVTCGAKSIPVTLTQRGKRSILLSPDRIEPLACGGDSFEVRVEANFVYEVEIRQEGEPWLQQVGSLPKESGTLYFKAASNPGSARTAVVVFRDTQSDYETELPVIQLGDPIQQDRAVLKELYETAGGASWTRSDHWNSDRPLSEWYGITLEDGRVVGIDLPDNNLVGTLPAALGELALRSLTLRGNKLSGTLPAGLRENPSWKEMNAAETIYPQAEGFGFSYSDGEVTCLQRAVKGKGIDVVFLGDGFTARELVLGTGFEAMVEEALEMFFGVEPMTAYRDYFNVYSVAAVSQESGIGVTKAKDTKFKTYFKELIGPTMTTDETVAYAYVSKAPVTDYTRTLVIMLANTTKYGGTTMAWDDNRAIAICPNYPASNPEQVDSGWYGMAGLIRHEAVGHGFAKLDEEYTTAYLQGPGPDYAAWLAARHRRGHSLNIDTTNDPKAVCWSHFIGRAGYEEVGVFEGGGGYPQGVWRPEKEPTCMKDDRPYFNAPSREQIVRRIKTLAGESFDFEEFVRQDLAAKAKLRK